MKCDVDIQRVQLAKFSTLSSSQIRCLSITLDFLPSNNIRDRVPTCTNKMGSSRYSQGDNIITDPDYMTRDSLFEISLTQLSKYLPQTTSSRATLSIYLRWLEVHRRQPTKRTEHWQNTLLHWAQSLRSRGFREYEIVAAVEDWKDANGPFRSEWRRYPPSPKEIAKAFDEMMERTRESERERSRERDLASRLGRPLGESHRSKELGHEDGRLPHRPRHELNKVKKTKRPPENFEGKPPPNYICNRCGKKGMRRAFVSPCTMPCTFPCNDCCFCIGQDCFDMKTAFCTTFSC